MADMSALHTLTAELHVGFLAMAMIGIGVTFLCQIVIRFGRGGVFSRMSVKIRGYTEAAGIMGAFFGVFALLLSAYTGMGSRTSFDILFNDPITANKILLTVVITGIWSMVVIVRLEVGKRLWTSGGFALFYTALAVFGFTLTTLTRIHGGAHHEGGEHDRPDPDLDRHRLYQILPAGCEHGRDHLDGQSGGHSPMHLHGGEDETAESEGCQARLEVDAANDRRVEEVTRKPFPGLIFQYPISSNDDGEILNNLDENPIGRCDPYQCQIELEGVGSVGTEARPGCRAG